MSCDPRLLADARRWPVPTPVRSLDDVLSWVGFGRPADDVDGDAALANLVAIAADDDLAARVVLQRLLPGLIRVAVRRARIVVGGSIAAFDELLACAWMCIRTFPIERRPHRVAANLLRDIEYLAFVRETRLHSRELGCGQAGQRLDEAMERTANHGEIAEITVQPASELRELLVHAGKHGVGDQHLALLVSIGAGYDSVQLAKVMDCTPRTVRNRRDAALTAVRGAMASTAEVAA